MPIVNIDNIAALPKKQLFLVAFLHCSLFELVVQRKSCHLALLPVKKGAVLCDVLGGTSMAEDSAEDECGVAQALYQQKR